MNYDSTQHDANPLQPQSQSVDIETWGVEDRPTPEAYQGKWWAKGAEDGTVTTRGAERLVLATMQQWSDDLHYGSPRVKARAQVALSRAAAGMDVSPMLRYVSILTGRHIDDICATLKRVERLGATGFECGTKPPRKRKQYVFKGNGLNPRRKKAG